MHLFLKELKALGFCGVQNFPTVGLIDGKFRQNLEETGMGYEQEVELIRIANQMDLLTTPYVFDVDEAERMTHAGADVLVAHMGLTTSGSIGASTSSSLQDCVKAIQDIRDAACRINKDIIVLCHGGPIANPEDARYVLQRTKGVQGFLGRAQWSDCRSRRPSRRRPKLSKAYLTVPRITIQGRIVIEVSSVHRAWIGSAFRIA